MVSWIVGVLIGVSFLLFIWLIVKATKDFEKQQAQGFPKKIEKDQYKGGLRWI